MNVEEVREYCLSIKGCEESIPFRVPILVFKVMDKMFALLTLEPKDGIFRINIKCNPDLNIQLQEKYNGICGATFTRQPTWCCIMIDSDVPNELIRSLISDSAEAVISKLSKKKQEEYKNRL